MRKFKQPDFPLLFRQTFAGPPRKVRYEIRFGGSNAHHDVIFLSSLVHDARFRLADVRLKGRRLTIPLERDCWEIPPTRTALAQELHITKSELLVAPVLRSEWTSDPLRDPIRPGRPDDEIWLRHIRLDATAFDDSDTG